MCSRTCSQRTEYTLMHEMCTDVQNVHWCMKCVHWCMKCALLAVNKKWSDSVQSALLVHICTSCVFCAHFMHQCTLCTYVSGGYRSVCTHHIIHKIKNSGWRNVLTHLFTTRSDSVRIFRINVHSGRLRCVQKCVHTSQDSQNQEMWVQKCMDELVHHKKRLCAYFMNQCIFCISRWVKKWVHIIEFTESRNVGAEMYWRTCLPHEWDTWGSRSLLDWQNRVLDL